MHKLVVVWGWEVELGLVLEAGTDCCSLSSGTGTVAGTGTDYSVDANLAQQD